MKYAAYWHLYRLRIAELLAYRAEFLLSTILGPLHVVSQYFLWTSIIGGAGSAAGYTIESIMAYYLMIIVISLFTETGVHGNLENLIKNGNLARIITKPMSLFGELFTRLVASVSYSFVTQSVPIFIISYFVLGSAILPQGTLAVTAIGVCIAAMIGFLLKYIIGLCAFWFTSIGGLKFLQWPLFASLGGLLFPLDLLPAGLEEVMFYLPFQHLYFAPAQYFLGTYEFGGVSDPWFSLSVGALWVIGLFIIVQFMQHRGMRRYQGTGQ